VGTAVEFRNMITGPKASMIKFWIRVVVTTVQPPRLCLGWWAQSEAKSHMYCIGLC
jgi:hypothetical protein